MGKSCCEGHAKTKNGIWYRSSTLVLSGLILYIPFLETLLSTGVLGWAFFALSTSLIVWTIVKDYRQEIGFCVATVLTTALVLSAPLMHSTNMSAVSIITALVVNAGLLFTKKYEGLPTGATQQVTKQSYINREVPKKSLIGWSFPTVEKIILLLAILNWGISLGSLLMPGAGVFLFSLHDTLLILGIYNAATYVKQSVQTSALLHNHHREVTKINANGKEEKVLLSELKKGMVIKIDSEMLVPVACCANTQCVITSDSSESMQQEKIGSIIGKNTIYHKGEVTCQEDYIPVTQQSQIQHTEDEDSLLTSFLVIALTVAAVAGFWQFTLLGSVIQGLKVFCINLIVACPCLFFITKPIIHMRFLEWLQNKSRVLFNKMPACGKPNILVFDRTHTLYEQDQKNKDGPYILNQAATRLLGKIKDMSIRCYILSGHGTDSQHSSWQENLKNCKKELDGLVKSQDIIFHSKFHDAEKGEKSTIIKNLQYYGQTTEPKSFVQKMVCRVRALFFPNTVGMIGDGNNDISAMNQADFAVAVAKRKDNFNTEVLQSCNFAVEQESLSDLGGLLANMEKVSWYSRLFLGGAFIYNLTMLAMVNGLSTYLLGFALPPATACLAVSSFCVSAVVLASRVKIDCKTDALELAKVPGRELKSSLDSPLQPKPRCTRGENTYRNQQHVGGFAQVCRRGCCG